MTSFRSDSAVSAPDVHTTVAARAGATVPRVPAVTSLRRITATRYVTPLREGGSMPGLVEADDDGLYVVKFRGAGQGPRRSWPR